MPRTAIAPLTAALLLPLAGLAVLLSRPHLDVDWEHHPAHFWLVLGTAIVSMALGLLLAEDARRRQDARVLLVGLAFLTAAGFLGLHALATPGVLLEGKNAGFALATPVGLLLASVLAVVSSLELGPEPSVRLVRRAGALRAGILVLLAAWAVISLASLPPLDAAPPERASGPLAALAIAGVGLYAIATFRYLRLYAARPAPLLLAVVAAFALLAEAMVAVAFARNWHATWWEWHALMATAIVLVAVVARREHAQSRPAFAGLYLTHTLGRVDARYAEAVAEVVGGNASAEEVARRYGLGADEARVLTQASAELRGIDERLGRYVSPQLAARLRTEPGLGELGGEEREVSVLFADLQGFTAFAERSEPAQVLAMLNEYWGVAVPLVLREHEGLIERFAGDAVMVVFNAASEQPDHPLRAARAALALQSTAGRLASQRPGWPRFRAGVSTGPALVGNVGGLEQRSFTAIGDTTNLAARLQASATPGEVLVSKTTYEAIHDRAETRPVPPLELKGKAEPVDAYVLLGVAP
jgi:class 3 adenylate cyclase